MEIKKILRSLAIAIISLALLVAPALAQAAPTLSLRLSRDFGYSSGTGRIQGTFSMIASGPDNLEQVTFKIDDQVVGTINESPFRLRFNTGNYPLGVHTITASGETGDGSLLESNVVRVEFVSSDEGWQSAAKIALPILGIVFAVMLFGFLFPLLLGRGKPEHLPAGAQRSYGMLGGGICPKCKRPFALHIFGLNLIGRKFDRCPYCGRWSMVRRIPLDTLRKAEAAELEAEKNAAGLPEDSEEEVRKQIEDSRYL
jgi:hypothetical protein